MDYLTVSAFFAGALVALSMTLLALRLVDRTKHKKQPPDPRVLTLMKQIGNLRIEVADLRDLYERLMTSHKRLRSSAGMAKLRAMDKEEEPAGSDAAVLAKLGLIPGAKHDHGK